jgi:hypothetical protein
MAIIPFKSIPVLTTILQAVWDHLQKSWLGSYLWWLKENKRRKNLSVHRISFFTITIGTK